MTLTDDEDDGEEKAAAASAQAPLTKRDEQLLQELSAKYGIHDETVARSALEVVKTLDSAVTDSLLKIDDKLLRVRTRTLALTSSSAAPHMFGEAFRCVTVQPAQGFCV